MAPDDAVVIWTFRSTRPDNTHTGRDKSARLHRAVEQTHAEGQRPDRHVRESGPVNRSTQRRLIEKSVDRARQVPVRAAPVARQKRRGQRHDATGVEVVQYPDDRIPWTAEFENHQPTAGSQHAEELVNRLLRLLHIPNAEGNGHDVERLGVVGQLHHITLVVPNRLLGLARLVAGDLEHAGREIDAGDRSDAGPLKGLCQIAGPAGCIEHVVRSRRSGRSNGCPAPGLITTE